MPGAGEVAFQESQRWPRSSGEASGFGAGHPPARITMLGGSAVAAGSRIRHGPVKIVAETNQFVFDMRWTETVGLWQQRIRHDTQKAARGFGLLSDRTHSRAVVRVVVGTVGCSDNFHRIQP